MRILFDTNVVLDDLLDRYPFVSAATALMEYIVQGRITGMLCGTTLTTIYYIATRTRSESFARSRCRELLRLFDIAPVDGHTLTNAFRPDFLDFEDAVIHESAIQAMADGIVTRDELGFQAASIQVYAPDELVEYIVAAGNDP